jgi:hypothetical protein
VRGQFRIKIRGATAAFASQLCSPRFVLLKIGAAWLLFFLSAYLLVWLALVPTLGRIAAQRGLSAALQRQTRIETLRINPLTLSIRIEGLRVEDKDGSELFSFSRFLAEPQPLGLLAGRMGAKNVLLENPRLRLTRESNGALNIADLLPAQDAASALTTPDPPKTAPPLLLATNFQIPAELPLYLEKISMVGGRLDFEDRLMNSSHAVTDLDFSLPLLQFGKEETLNELATRAAVNAAPVSLRLTLRLPGAPQAGQAVQPSSATVSAELSVRDFILRRYSAYLPGHQLVDVELGEAELKAEASFPLASAAPVQTAAPAAPAPVTGWPVLRVGLSAARLEARDMAGVPYFKLAALRVEETSIELDPASLASGGLPSSRVGRVTVNGPWLRAERPPSGGFALPGLSSSSDPIKPPLSERATEIALVESIAANAAARAAGLAATPFWGFYSGLATGSARALAKARLLPLFTPPRPPSLPLRVDSIDVTEAQLLLVEKAESTGAQGETLFALNDGRLRVQGLDCSLWRAEDFELALGSSLFGELRFAGQADLSSSSGRATLALKGLDLQRLPALAPAPLAARLGIDPAATRLLGNADLHLTLSGAIKDGELEAELLDAGLFLRELEFEREDLKLRLGGLELAGLRLTVDAQQKPLQAGIGLLEFKELHFEDGGRQSLDLEEFRCADVEADHVKAEARLKELELSGLSLRAKALPSAAVGLEKLKASGLDANLGEKACELDAVEAHGLSLRAEGAGKTGAAQSLSSLRLTGLKARVDADLAPLSFEAATVAVSNGGLRVERRADGVIALPGLPAGGQGGGKSPQWSLGAVSAENVSVDFYDEQVKAGLKLLAESVRVEHASSAFSRPIGLTARLLLDGAPKASGEKTESAGEAPPSADTPAPVKPNTPDKAKKSEKAPQSASSGKTQLEFAGEAALSPLAAKGRVRVVDARLNELTPWAPPLPLTPLRGRLRAAGDIAYAPDSLHYAGDFGLDDFACKDPALDAETVVWASLALTGLDFGLSPLSVKLKTLSLDRGAFTLRLSKELSLRAAGTDIPLGAAAKAATQKQAPAKPAPVPAKPTGTSRSEADSSDLRLSIDRIETTGTQLLFQDAGFTPPYEARISDIRAEIAGLTTGKAAYAEVSAKVNHTGRVKAAGSFWPFSKHLKLELKASAEGLDLTDASPYSRKYTGFPIARGKFGCALDYRIERKSLDLKNELLLSKVEIGPKAQVAGAMDVPLDLGVSLLADGNGDIALSIPIKNESGEFNVDVGPFIGKAFSGFFGKIFFAPFSVLGGMESAGNNSYLAFAPGSAALSPASQTQLTELAKGVSGRPKLSLELVGRADRNADAPGLKLQILRKRLPSLAGESGDGDKLSDADYQRLLRKAYLAAYGKVQASSTELMEKALSSKTQVSEEEWRAFARQRALAAHSFLVEVGKLPEGRIFLAEREADPSNPAQASRVDLYLKY